MVGRDDLMAAYLERAHKHHLESGAILQAARAGVWIGISLALRGEVGPASGWFGRTHRLVERHGAECAEAGYLLIPEILRNEAMGNHDAAIAVAEQAAAIGERFNEPDLIALALHGHGKARVRMGDVARGLRLLDEAMVAVTADELSPIVTGIVYCSVIEGCYEVRELRRAHAWTEALSAWCSGQPDLVAFTGQCLTHRAELMQLRGDWAQAMAEAERAGRRFGAEMNQLPAAQAHYRRGELHRLRGEYDEAEAAYREAGTWGWSPQPGLALLRLAQGQADVARTALETAVTESHEPIDRARHLPAMVELLVAVADVEAATEAQTQLSALAESYADTMIAAAALVAEGQVQLARAQPDAALGPLGSARAAWLELDAPYEVARTRALLADAYQALGDEEAAALERAGASLVFEQLGAQPDLDRLAPSDEVDSPLTDRELEVLRLVAEGKTNKAIADDLFVSNRTIDRHLSNIFTKLGVTSRTAAAAYAFEHGLV